MKKHSNKKPNDLVPALEVEEKGIFIKLLVIIGIPFLSYFIIKDLLTGRYLGAFLLTLLILLLIFVFPFLRRRLETRRENESLYQGSFYLFFLILGTVLFYLLGIERDFSRTPWFFIFPLLAFLALGYRIGLILTIVLIVSIFVFNLFDADLMPVVADELKFRFFISAVVITIISFFMERWRSQYKQDLIVQRKLLIKSETKLKKSNQEFQRSEEKYRLLAETAGEIIFSLDFEGKIKYINKKGLELSGYTLEEALNANLDLIIPEDKIEYVKTLLVKRSQGYSEQLLYETEFINKSGGLVFVEVSSNLMLRDGRPHGVLVSARDITERNKRKRDLEKSELKYSNLIHTMQEGLVGVDSEWNITLVNQRFSELIGYTNDKLIGSSFFALISTDTRHIAEEQHLIRQNGANRQYELKLITSENKEIYVLCSPNPSYDENGKYLGGFGVISNITERKLIEKERENLILDLQDALENIKTLKGLIPICSSCKKIRDDKGYWNILESYIQRHSDAQFSHSMCPDCSDKFYGDEDWYIQLKKKKGVE